MLVNLANVLRIAEERKIAIGSFNVYNVESLQAVWKAAQESGEPVIISFGESYDAHMPLEAMAALVKHFAQSSPIPAVLHLDHSKALETIVRALAAGFTSVMFDGSSLPLAENIRRTAEVARIAHILDASVEGELGYMNPEDGTAGDAGQMGECTSVADAQQYAESSGADALAIAIGNAHGIYKGTPHLDFQRLEEIRRAVSLPLVLHGSSGIPEDMLKKAIRLGIRKININTEVSTMGIQASREFLDIHKDPNTRFEAMAKAAEQRMMRVVKDDISCFTQKA